MLRNHSYVLSLVMIVRVIWCLPLLLAGCSLLGGLKPETQNERLAYAYTTHTAVLQATTTGVNAGQIGSADAEQILGLADESRELLDAARAALAGGDTSTAEGKLQLGLTILQQLQLYLRSP